MKVRLAERLNELGRLDEALSHAEQGLRTIVYVVYPHLHTLSLTHPLARNSTSSLLLYLLLLLYRYSTSAEGIVLRPVAGNLLLLEYYVVLPYLYRRAFTHLPSSRASPGGR